MARKGSSNAVATFLAGLSVERRREAARVLETVRHHLPSGYEVVISKGMLVYQVPLKYYPDTYNGHALWYVALASQKSYLSLHVLPVYADSNLAQQLADGFHAAGKKLNMGKACIHFKTADDLALDVIAEIVAEIPLERWVQIAKSARRR